MGKWKKTIIETLESTIGKTQTQVNKPRKTKNDRTKLQNKRRKEAKQNFEEACKTQNPEEKVRRMTEYMETPKNLRNEVENAERLKRGENEQNN